MKFIKYITKRRYNILDSIGISFMYLFIFRKEYICAIIILLVGTCISVILENISKNK